VGIGERGQKRKRRKKQKQKQKKKDQGSFWDGCSLSSCYGGIKRVIEVPTVY
jgi:hypothetical protein